MATAGPCATVRHGSAKRKRGMFSLCLLSIRELPNLLSRFFPHASVARIRSHPVLNCVTAKGCGLTVLVKIIIFGEPDMKKSSTVT